MTVVLAIDGGNSKTDVVAADARGKILGRVRGPGCSPDALGISGSVDMLSQLIEQTREEARLPLGERSDAAALMLAGVDRPDQESDMREALSGLSIADRMLVTNDTFAVLQAGSVNGWGVAVVCGAGLNAVGVTPGGQVGRYQALGALSGDWGGGGDVGVAALGAAIRGEDGRGWPTVLTIELGKRFEVDKPQEIAAAIHEGRLDERVLVEMTPLVFECAAAGDEVARRIIDRVADEVSVMATAMLHRLELDALDVEVVLGGGLMQSGYQPLLDRTERLVRTEVPTAVVRVLDAPPVIGCAREAFRMTSLSTFEIDTALRNLKTALIAEKS
ncbi:MAG: N-acetylglucosamine kinase [Actinomycetes bacterium]